MKKRVSLKSRIKALIVDNRVAKKFREITSPMFQKIGNTSKRIFGPYFEKMKKAFYTRFPDGRKDPRFSNILFWITMALLTAILILQPSANFESKRLLVYSVITKMVIFSIMAIALNLHTGYSGLVNFGVIFFAGIGAVGTGLLISAYGVDPLLSIALSVLIAVAVGYLLSYPTIRLRADYFAIVTIALGEILRLALIVDPFLKSGTEKANIESPGIANIKGPFQDWWEATGVTMVRFKWTGMGFKIETYQETNYFFFLSIFGIILLAGVYVFSEYLVNSPYGRALKGIREDEEAVESYGVDVFHTKAWILGIGSGIAALAGGLWAWALGFIGPSFMNPAASTFLVWAAFILGGKANNKGMILGAYIIVLSDQTFRGLATLSGAERQQNIFLRVVDDIFRFIVVDIGGFLFGKSSYEDTLGPASSIEVDVNFLQISLVGLIIIISMMKFEEGILPEIPYRPRKIVEEITGKTKFESAQEASQKAFLEAKQTEKPGSEKEKTGANET